MENSDSSSQSIGDDDRRDRHPAGSGKSFAVGYRAIESCVMNSPLICPVWEEFASLASSGTDDRKILYVCI